MTQTKIFALMLLVALPLSVRGQTNQPAVLAGLCTEDMSLTNVLAAAVLRLWGDNTALFRGDLIETQQEAWVDVTSQLNQLWTNGQAVVGVLYTRQPWRCDSDGLPDLTWNNQPSMYYYDMSPWMQYVWQVTSQYSSQVRIWEIWDSPDTTNSWGSRTAAQYMEMVRQAAFIIRTLDAGIIVAGGGMSPSSPLAQGCLTNGLLRLCDVVSLHYGFSPAPSGKYKADSYAKLARYTRAVKLASNGLMTVWDTKSNVLNSLQSNPHYFTTNGVWTIAGQKKMLLLQKQFDRLGKLSSMGVVVY